MKEETDYCSRTKRTQWQLKVKTFDSSVLLNHIVDYIIKVWDVTM